MNRCALYLPVAMITTHLAAETPHADISVSAGSHAPFVDIDSGTYAAPFFNRRLGRNTDDASHDPLGVISGEMTAAAPRIELVAHRDRLVNGAGVLGLMEYLVCDDLVFESQSGGPGVVQVGLFAIAEWSRVSLPGEPANNACGSPGEIVTTFDAEFEFIDDPGSAGALIVDQNTLPPETPMLIETTTVPRDLGVEHTFRIDITLVIGHPGPDCEVEVRVGLTLGMSENPDGTFGPVFSLPPGVTANAESIGLIDNYIHPVSVPCEPQFAFASEPWTGWQPNFVVSADFDNDGDNDLATADKLTNAVSVLLNHGDGTFAQRDEHQLPCGVACNSLFGLTPGDLDGDGDVDIAAADYLNGRVGILRNTGGGSFSQWIDTFPIGRGVDTLALADFDGDGDLDIAGSLFDPQPEPPGYGDPGMIAVMFNDGSASFSAPTLYAAGAGPLAVQAGDIDLDGDTDLVFGNWANQFEIILVTPRSLGVLLNNGDGSFAPMQITELEHGGLGIVELELGDLNGDGYLDAAAVFGHADAFGVMLGNGDGSFGGLEMFLSGDHGSGLALADFDGDGDLDAVTTNRGDDGMPGAGTAGVLLNRGDAAFDPVAWFPVGSGPGSAPEAVAAADLDGDGLPDLAVANKAEDTVTVLLNRISGCPCSVADTAPPFGVLDLSDISTFAAAFLNAQPGADLAPPFGIWDLSDIGLFIDSFVAGCP